MLLQVGPTSASLSFSYLYAMHGLSKQLCFKAWIVCCLGYVIWALGYLAQIKMMEKRFQQVYTSVIAIISLSDSKVNGYERAQTINKFTKSAYFKCDRMFKINHRWTYLFWCSFYTELTKCDQILENQLLFHVLHPQF